MHTVRIGKTKRDLANGCAKRNGANKAQREAWQQAGPRDNTAFPAHTCNGRAAQALRARVLRAQRPA